mgnify:CR=1 FL=1
MKFQGFGVGPLEPVLRPEERTWLVALKARDLEELPFEVRADLPDWIVARLREYMRLPGMGETTARYFRDKLAERMKAAIEQAKITAE